MGLKEQLLEDMKAAMRAREEARLETVRAVRGAITKQEVDGGTELDDKAILDIIRGLRKQRVESIEQYRAGGREDLVEREQTELAVLEAYLPAAPDQATVERTVRALIDELGASGMKDMGKVMKAAKEQLPAADGKSLSGVVRGMLA